MSRQCTVCTHPKRKDIDKSLIHGESNQRIAADYSLTETCVRRHKKEHLAQLLAEAERTKKNSTAQTELARQNEDHQIHALDLLQQLTRQVERANLLSDALDRWLRDPEDLTRYSIDPRAGDISVIYHSPGEDGRPIRRKRRLSEIIGEIEGAGWIVDHVETKHADPRELLLKASDSIKGQMTLLLSVLDKLYNAQEMEAFQTALLRTIAEAAPDVHDAITSALRQRSPMGAYTRPGLRQSE